MNSDIIVLAQYRVDNEDGTPSAGDVGHDERRQQVIDYLELQFDVADNTPNGTFLLRGARAETTCRMLHNQLVSAGHLIHQDRLIVARQSSLQHILPYGCDKWACVAAYDLAMECEADPRSFGERDQEIIRILRENSDARWSPVNSGWLLCVDSNANSLDGIMGELNICLERRLVLNLHGEAALSHPDVRRGDTHETNNCTELLEFIRQIDAAE